MKQATASIIAALATMCLWSFCSPGPPPVRRPFAIDCEVQHCEPLPADVAEHAEPVAESIDRLVIDTQEPTP